MDIYTAWFCEIGSLTTPDACVTQVHPVKSENQFHCTRLYIYRLILYIYIYFASIYFTRMAR